jgi:hypothetical protein
MRKASTKTARSSGDDMRTEYDFAGGTRGKHYRAMQAGYTITIRQSDGTTVVKEVEPRTDAVVLAPDVREYFPDSESVNTALRSLIKLIPERRDERPRRAGGAETRLPSASRSRSRRAGTKT